MYKKMFSFLLRLETLHRLRCIHANISMYSTTCSYLSIVRLGFIALYITVYKYNSFSTNLYDVI